MWEDLIRKAKHGGLDVIDTYVFWDVHEPSPHNVIIHDTLILHEALKKMFFFFLMLFVVFLIMGCIAVQF
jgi:hypothetical protein